MTERRWRALWLCMMLLIMLVIFVLSHQPSEESYRLSVAVSKVVKATPAETNRKINYGRQQSGQNFNLFGKFNIRKTAHLLLYTFLGISTFFALKPGKWRPLLTFGVDYAYAFTDEIHQRLVGRTGVFSDTLRDAVGILAAIALCMLVTLLWRKHKAKRRN